MTPADFFNVIAQLAILLFMITMLALWKKLTTPRLAQSVKLRAHERYVVDQRDGDSSPLRGSE
jgi:hypothetical protein